MSALEGTRLMQAKEYLGLSDKTVLITGASRGIGLATYTGPVN